MSKELHTTSKIPVFICYRQSDGLEVAAKLYELLNTQMIPIGSDESTAILDVYFDQTSPGVADWKSVHEPFLKRSHALIVVCSPGAKIREGDKDWVHREIDWWIDNRPAAPILVDPLGQGSRYVPDRIATRWPDAQRIPIVLKEWARLTDDELIQTASLTRQRLIGGIVPSVGNVYKAELEIERLRTEQLTNAFQAQKSATKKLKSTLVVISLLLVFSLALQRNLSNFRFEILLKVCHTTKQPLKKEAGHVTRNAIRRIPLSSPKV